MTTHRRSLLKHAGLIAASFPFVPAAWAQTLGYPRTLQGPMVGAPTPTSLRVWVRTSGTFDVILEAATRRDFADVRASAPMESNAGNDFCVAPQIEELTPATAYFYRFKFDGVTDRYQPLPYRTKTAPRGRARFRVAFGSCARLQIDTDQRIFTVAQALEPDLMFFLGDNIYADSAEPAALADLYRRQREIERLKPFIRSTPSLAIWDDHDFALNDSDRNNPIRTQALDLFKTYWANPSYGLPQTPGIFFKYEYGGVDFFFLDGRYNRHPTDYEGADKTMLGAEQKAWLKDQLRASRAPFKVLVSGGGFSKAERGGDSWAVYTSERDELLGFIRDNHIEGVFGISGDSHMGELNCVPRSEQGGYDLYDFCSSPLANFPDSDFVDQMPEVRIRPTYTRSVNVGLMEFDFDDGPRMTYTLHNMIGAPAWAPLVLTPADLRNGVSTWRAKIDPRELQRLERYRAGGSYFDPEGDG
ncbi:alkaline phosphatase D family protein [Terricaulis silvestris]|uniref:Alkaline phosphatase D n=1 Tax=Terricaulis silvestris TaxID=2686094 RepID=A0A6I6MG15_9CAUL|nr:alkaline phosphatase D family protein [Terricaulis silvestris]QGZ93545.1 Alkaline phosphatase D precursor [Terricaulis silvestris]